MVPHFWFQHFLCGGYNNFSDAPAGKSVCMGNGVRPTHCLKSSFEMGFTFCPGVDGCRRLEGKSSTGSDIFRSYLLFFSIP